MSTIVGQDRIRNRNRKRQTLPREVLVRMLDRLYRYHSIGIQPLGGKYVPPIICGAM